MIIRYISTCIVGIILFSSCGMYSFTGASIPPNTKTVSVQYFSNKAANIQPSLSQIFTEKLKDTFVEQTNLILSDHDGDLTFSGYISKYQIKPMAISSAETPEQNRLIIEVNVIFNNSLEEDKNFDQTFSRYKDYKSSLNVSDIEDFLIEEITKELVEDVFNKAVVNW